jgi:16S rRNA (guanine527-N7)-methyltransferase
MPETAGFPSWDDLFHVKQDARLQMAAIDAGRRAQLDRYGELLQLRAVPLGFIADSDRDRLMDRHVLDSLRAVPCLRPSDLRLADLGSGAGLPGIPVAIALPDRTMTLVEPMQRRAAFLELAVRELGLRNTEVVVSRAERAAITVDVCLIRALAGPEMAWRLARPLLRPGGRLLFFAGASWSGDGNAIRRSDPITEECLAARFGMSGPVVIMRQAATPQGPDAGKG